MKRSSLYDSVASRLSTASSCAMSAFCRTICISCMMMVCAGFIPLLLLVGRGVRCSLPTKAFRPSAAQASKSAQLVTGRAIMPTLDCFSAAYVRAWVATSAPEKRTST